MRANPVLPLALTSTSSLFIVSRGPKLLLNVVNPSTAIAGTLQPVFVCFRKVAPTPRLASCNCRRTRSSLLRRQPPASSLDALHQHALHVHGGFHHLCGREAVQDDKSPFYKFE